MKIVKDEKAECLRNDVNNVLNQREWINRKSNSAWDATRILGVVASKEGAENYLPYTIPKIIKQINDLGFNADIIIGFNNGFVCPSVMECISLSGAELTPLYSEAKTCATIPSLVFVNPELTGASYRIGNVDTEKQPFNRVFCIHQKKGKFEAGKIRILLDIYQLLLDSLDVGWIAPKYTVLFDSESVFLINKEKIDVDSNGLKTLINKISQNSSTCILGAAIRNAVYNEQNVMVLGKKYKLLMPDFDILVPPIQMFLNLLHGQCHRYSWIPGGGTVGNTDIIISLLIVIAKTYPYTKGDDILTSILAHHAKFHPKMITDVIITNRCAGITEMDMELCNGEKINAGEQSGRWISARHELEMIYGKKNILLVTGYGTLGNIVITLIVIFKQLLMKTLAEKVLFIKRCFSLLNAIKAAKRLKKSVPFESNKDDASW